MLESIAGNSQSKTALFVTNKKIREARSLLKLAGPLIMNNLAIAGMAFADAIMAGQIGASELSAVAVGGSVWFLGFTVGLGLMMAISPIAARLYGAGKVALIGRYTRQGLWLALVLGLIFFAFIQLFAGPLLTFVGIDIAFRDMAIGYVEAIVFGAPAVFVFLAFRFTTEGIGHTRPIMITSLLALICNVILNYAFMFGNFGAPELGAVGCGVASAITMWLIMIALGGHIFFHSQYRPLQIFSRISPLRMPILKEIISLGFPISMTITAEAGLFSAVSILVGTRGPSITAAHQIALNFASTMFMIPLALSAATTIRIGHALGVGDPVAARLSGFTGIYMCGLFMAMSAMVLLVFKDTVVGIYTQDPTVQAIAISMLLMAAVFQVADGIQIGAAGALRGYKDTRVPMVINIFSFWVLAFPISYLAAVTYRAPPAYIWLGFVIGLTIAAFMLTVRYTKVSRVGRQATQNKPEPA